MNWHYARSHFLSYSSIKLRMVTYLIRCFMSLAFRDVDMQGNLVERNATISQEHCQRSKNLSHKVQRQLRVKRLDNIQAEKQRKNVVASQKLDKMLKDSEECKKNVLAQLNKIPDLHHLH